MNRELQLTYRGSSSSEAIVNWYSMAEFPFDYLRVDSVVPCNHIRGRNGGRAGGGRRCGSRRGAGGGWAGEGGLNRQVDRRGRNAIIRFVFIKDSVDVLINVGNVVAGVDLSKFCWRSQAIEVVVAVVRVGYHASIHNICTQGHTIIIIQWQTL